MTYLTEPIVYPADPSRPSRRRLRSLMQRARAATNHSETVRACIFGDSTWTIHGGAGGFAHRYLLAKVGSLFGNLPGLSLINVAGNVSGGAFIAAGANGVQSSPFATTYNMTAIGGYLGGLPKLGEVTYNPNITFNINDDRFGAYRFMLYGQKFFTPDNLKIEGYAAKRSNSAGGITISYRPTDKAYSLFEFEADRETIPLDVDQATSDVELVKFTTKAFTSPFGSKINPVFWFGSSEDTTVGAGSKAPLLLSSVRVVNANPVGVMFDSFSGGGYQATTWFGATTAAKSGLWQNSQNHVAQLEHDIWFFQLGVNDLYSGTGLPSATIRRNLYDSDGVHKGMIGNLLDARKDRGLEPPLIVLVNPAFRGDDDGANYETQKAEHENNFSAELIGLVDELNADGYDAMFLNLHRFAYLRGFNSVVNDFNGLSSVGTYDTGAVSYSVGDVYTGTDGREYKCLAAHTSSTSTEPTDDGGNSLAQYHAPIHTHFSGTVTGGDFVHWSAEGSEIVADAYAHLLATHYEESEVRFRKAYPTTY